MVVGFSAYHQVVSLNPAHGEVYSMQLYVIDLFSLGTGIPPPIKLTTMIITEILVLLVEEYQYPEKTNRLHKVAWSTPRHERDSNSQLGDMH
jgi:hypothetical protein